MMLWFFLGEIITNALVINSYSHNQADSYSYIHSQTYCFSFFLILFKLQIQ